jgi:hypothetical protein
MKITTNSQTIIADPVAMPNAHIVMTERMFPVMQRQLSLTYIK